MDNFPWVLDLLIVSLFQERFTLKDSPDRIFQGGENKLSTGYPQVIHKLSTISMSINFFVFALN